MNSIALKMLTGDRAKYLGLIFAIAFASFLIAQQISIFCGIMIRTTSQIKDVTDADIWIMDRETQYFDEVKTLTENDLYRVRSVAGVNWATRLFKGQPTLRNADGRFRTTILMGLDDATLTGAPHQMLLGNVEDLRRPDAVILDRAGFEFFFPGQRLRTGDVFELNDRRAVIVGISEASAPFTTFPVLFTRYSCAVNYVGRERNQLSFVLAKAAPGVPPAEVCARIRKETGLKAMTEPEFAWSTVAYYLKNTGIPVNFGLTIIIGVVVGTVVAGQTFYIFTIENLKQFAALKAIGVTNIRLVGMIVLQALVVGAIGYALGMGMCTALFEVTVRKTATRGMFLLWQAMGGTGVVIFCIIILASLLSIRKVLVLEPAVVFRS